MAYRPRSGTRPTCQQTHPINDRRPSGPDESTYTAAGDATRSSIPPSAPTRRRIALTLMMHLRPSRLTRLALTDPEDHPSCVSRHSVCPVRPLDAHGSRDDTPATVRPRQGRTSPPPPPPRGSAAARGPLCPATGVSRNYPRSRAAAGGHLGRGGGRRSRTATRGSRSSRPLPGRVTLSCAQNLVHAIQFPVHAPSCMPACSLGQACVGPRRLVRRPSTAPWAATVV